MNFFLYFRVLALLIELQFLINLRGFITFKYSIISPKCSPFVGIKVNTKHLVAKSAVNQGFMWNHSTETYHIGKYSTRVNIQGAFYLIFYAMNKGLHSCKSAERFWEPLWLWLCLKWIHTLPHDKDMWLAAICTDQWPLILSPLSLRPISSNTSCRKPSW